MGLCTIVRGCILEESCIYRSLKITRAPMQSLPSINHHRPDFWDRPKVHEYQLIRIFNQPPNHYHEEYSLSARHH